MMLLGGGRPLSYTCRSWSTRTNPSSPRLLGRRLIPTPNSDMLTHPMDCYRQRQDGLRVETIHDKGYLPQALVNFVAMLGWVPEDDREIFLTLADLVSAFDVSVGSCTSDKHTSGALSPLATPCTDAGAPLARQRLNRSPAVVNMDKLDWIQRQHMQSMESGSETFAAALDFLQTRAPAMYPKAEPQLLSRDSLADVLHISKGTFTVGPGNCCCWNIDEYKDSSEPPPPPPAFPAFPLPRRCWNSWRRAATSLLSRISGLQLP